MRIADNPSTKVIDIFHMVYQLRKERRYMVQSLAQYAFVYRCLHEYMAKKDSADKATSTTPDLNGAANSLV